MIKQLIPALCALLLSGAAQALEFKALGNNAIAYDAGSRQAKPLFILLKSTPVEVIISLQSWVKVREQSGGIAWIERNLITEAKQVIVTTPVAEIRSKPEDTAPATLIVAKDVLLDPIEPAANGWVKVRHRDGNSGFVRISSVWGI